MHPAETRNNETRAQAVETSKMLLSDTLWVSAPAAEGLDRGDGGNVVAMANHDFVAWQKTLVLPPLLGVCERLE